MKKSLSLSLLLIPSVLFGCGTAARKSGPVQSGLAQYVQQARATSMKDHQSSGSLWTETGNRADPFRDDKAYRVADIVTIAVLESTNAVSTATTDSSRVGSASASLPNLFGLEKVISELPSLLDIESQSDFEGDASTTRRSTLTTSVTARVVEVFPNGNLLLEGNRELLINGERQVVTVRGVVRPSDISPQNIVASTSIAEMEIMVDGHGIVTQAQTPGILSQILSGVWPF